MSEPFVYTPARVEYRNSPYLAPFVNQQFSPFIPQLSLSGSPFIPNNPLPDSPQFIHSPLPPGSPFVPNDIPFPTSSDDLDPVTPWSTNRRRLSWNGGVVPPTMQNTSYLQPRAPRRQRTRSDSGYFDQQPQIVNINNGYWVSPGNSPYGVYAQLPPVAPQVTLHPYIDAHAGRGDVVFDLSTPQFCPMRIVAHGQTVVLTVQELGEVASHPPMFNMKIICDLIPQWPIDIAWNSRYSPVPVPIKVGDILNAIWHFLHARISQELWASLNSQETHMVSRAYTARYRATRGYENAIARDGVKKIDFLYGKKWFRGLSRTETTGVFKMSAL